jgi:uncharacterized protein
MKFEPDTLAGVNQITRQEPGRIWVGGTVLAHSVLVPWRGDVLAWGVASFGELGVEHFERIVALRPAVVIFGSGARLRFAPPALLRALMEQRIGVETMDTPAACRTYNVLVNEGRAVLAALLVERPAQPPT